MELSSNQNMVTLDPQPESKQKAIKSVSDTDLIAALAWDHLVKQAMIIIASSNLIMVSSSFVHSLGSNKGIWPKNAEI